MFTGIIQAVGEVAEFLRVGGDLLLEERREPVLLDLAVADEVEPHGPEVRFEIEDVHRIELATDVAAALVHGAVLVKRHQSIRSVMSICM